MDDFVFFPHPSGTGNLLRPGQQSSFSQPKASSNTSNLVKYWQLVPSSQAKPEEEGTSSETPAYQLSSRAVFSFSDMELEEGVKKLGDFLLDSDAKIEDKREASLFFTILERQRKVDYSLYNFFEMLREIDPNRGRPYRMRLVRALHPHFEDKGVAKVVTEALSREWKSAQKEEQNKDENKSLEGSINHDLADLLQFNKRFLRWSGFFRALKRKESSVTGSGTLVDVFKEKDSIYCGSLLAMLQNTETIQKEFRQVMSNMYSQFIAGHQGLFQAFEGNSMAQRKDVYTFLHQIYVAMMILEVLEHYSNILKLDGPSARTICPDKKQFIANHLARIHSKLMAGRLGTIQAFADFLNPDFSVQNFVDVRYSRKEIYVRVEQPIANKKFFFTYEGSVDKLDAIQVTMDKG